MAYQTMTTGTDAPALGARVILTFLGAAGMIIGAFLHWTDGMVGTKVGLRTLWTASTSSAPTFISSVGALVIGLGLISILSLALDSGWLTRLAGSLGIIAVVLLAIEVFRASTSGSGLEIGAWISGVGSLVVLTAGLLGGARTITTTSSQAVPPPPSDVVDP